MPNENTPKSSTSLLEAALLYAGKGWPVFPLNGIIDGVCTCSKNEVCTSAGKHPITRNGFKDASIGEKTIRGWWSSNPHANIGIPTGRQTFDVLDIDGPEGEESFKALEDEHGPVPVTMQQQTGRGRHILFKGGTLGNSTGRIGKGIDTKSDRGYIVVAPSQHFSGKRYRWSSGFCPELPDPPEWLVSSVKSHVSKEGLGSAGAPAFVVCEGERNDFLASQAGKLRKIGHRGSTLAGILLVINAEVCAPPLTETEVRNIAKSISKYYGPKLGEGIDSDDGERTNWEYLDKLVSSTEWLWPGWIPKGYLTVIAGDPGVGKSVFALNLAAICFQGGKWPDGAVVEDPTGPVVWAEAEGSQGANLERMKNFEFSPLGFINPFPTDQVLEDFRIDDEGHLRSLRNTIARYLPQLVVIDSLAASHRLRENDAEIHGLLANVRNIARDFQVAIVIIHHLRKGPKGGRDAVHQDDLRGSSAIIGVVRSILILDQPGESGTVRISHAKSNLGPKRAPFGFEWKKTSNGREFLEFGAAPSREKKLTVESIIESDLRNLLADGEYHGAKSSIEDLVGLGHTATTVQKVSSAMVNEGIIEKSRPKKGQKGWRWRLFEKSNFSLFDDE